MKGLTIQQMAIGDSATFTKTVSESDVYQFAGITGDFNPAHINEEYAKDTVFKTRIAHGMLSAGFISTVLGTRLPGPGTIYLRQELKFLAPVRIGDTITAKAEITGLVLEKNRVTLRTTCTNQEGVLVVDGEALMSPPKA
ncbi:MaoC family dehydratase [Desulfobotulus sp.]|jgi:3-hydroxybutyryl-CoA dehydratase|uniref:MaoC family dehydratase n=1 Tax=Desulfobotulus sp. TaxID=1940337 RepID=UPI002A367AD7|nr:MaoC family dehydratase [Desulfobotulus sp.]MDY0161745.1 MaoC family dehydratase [Desulfobotulus sp.]